MLRTLAWPEPCEGLPRRFQMVLTAATLSPVLAILFGILIFVFPRLLNYLVATYLVLSGLIGLGVLSLR
jgi:phage shock protein PspC (stress-responsive transcriptional regulator)